jgi:hypothetical protein
MIVGQKVSEGLTKSVSWGYLQSEIEQCFNMWALMLYNHHQTIVHVLHIHTGKMILFIQDLTLKLTGIGRSCTFLTPGFNIASNCFFFKCILFKYRIHSQAVVHESNLGLSYDIGRVRWEMYIWSSSLILLFRITSFC